MSRKAARQNCAWTKTDLEKLCRWWGEKTVGWIAKELRRSEEAVRVRARKVGLVKSSRESRQDFTKAEEEYIQKNHHRKSQVEIARELGRPASSVSGKMRSMRLTKGRPRKAWKKAKRYCQRYKPQEIEFIQENWGSMTPKQIASKLRRTEAGVRTFAYRLGLLFQDNPISKQDQ